MSKIPADQKGKHMADIGLDYAVIQQAEAGVLALRVQAAPKIKDVMSSFGPGPHKMPVPTGATDPATGAPVTKDMIVTFRKDGDAYAISAIPADSIT
jgi:hypothetical protein